MPPRHLSSLRIAVDNLKKNLQWIALGAWCDIPVVHWFRVYSPHQDRIVDSKHCIICSYPCHSQTQRQCMADNKTVVQVWLVCQDCYTIRYCASAGASGGGAEGPAPRRKFWPPTRIHKVILQETTVTMVLYTLPAVEPIIRVNDSAIIIVAHILIYTFLELGK